MVHFKVNLTFLVLAFINVRATNLRDVFDLDLYERVLDSDLCQKQLDYLSRNSAGLYFLDASGKPPSSISQFNLKDYGDYPLCLSLNFEVPEEPNIEGKYCMVKFPLALETISTWQDVTGSYLPRPTWPNNETLALHKQYKNLRRQVQMVTGYEEGSSRDTNVSMSLALELGLCVPKTCTATQALNYFLDRVPILNIEFEESFCRLPNDKPFSTADLVATIIFSTIGLVTFLSTSYDLYHVFLLKSKSKSPLLTSFSAYTNTKRFLTFNKIPGAVECLDGIRAISMLWIIVGHSFSSTLLGPVHNFRYHLEFVMKFSTVWLNAAPLSVDTFFLLSGILCVYSTIGKMRQSSFIKNIPMFYLNRFLRMFPVLAVVVLFCSSLVFHSSDGPEWSGIVTLTSNCRKTWWVAFIFLQNYVRNNEMCMGHSWYLSVDFQLYLLSPLILIWLFGRRYFAWSALVAALLTSLIGASVYSFYYDFSAAIFGQTDEKYLIYMRDFYVNTLPRSAPFCIGMIYGYILHLLRDKDLILNKAQALLLWLLAFGMMAFVIFTMYPVVQPDFDNQFLDNFLNAYMRAIWAVAVGWLIVACAKGYGGPINWMLCLQVWKLPARLSYAMYLIHYILIYIANNSWMKSHYFGNAETIYRFFSDASMTMLISFAVCIVVDAPFSTLQKILLGSPKKHMKPKTESQTNIPTAIESNDFIKTKV